MLFTILIVRYLVCYRNSLESSVIITNMKTSLQYMTPKSTRTKKRPTASSYLPLLKKVLAREKEIEELEVALREIQESKTYRLWQSYCQLRNALFSVKNNELPHYGHNSMYESLEEHFLSEFDRCQR